MSFTAFQTQVKTNSNGPLLFFPAMKPLLEKGKQPRFIVLGLLRGSISGITIHPFLRGANEARKAMLNYIMRNMPFEEKGLISFPVEPGWVGKSSPLSLSHSLPPSLPHPFPLFPLCCSINLPKQSRSNNEFPAQVRRGGLSFSNI